MDKAHLLFNYLKNDRSEIFAELVSDEIDENEILQSFEFEVDVDLPQRPVNAVNKTEKIKVFFSRRDESAPTCQLQRENFPSVPHLNLEKKGDLKTICLYERPWIEERNSWSPWAYVERIRTWFRDTACGTLHRPNQPLEPMLLNGLKELVILPEIEARADIHCWKEELFLYFCDGEKGKILLSRKLLSEKKRDPIPLLVYQCEPSVHGIIDHTPSNLGELVELVKSKSVNDPMSSIVELVRANYKCFLNSENKNLSLLFVVLLPKKRDEEGEIETVENWIFATKDNFEDLCLKLEIVGKHPDGGYAPLVGVGIEEIIDAEKLSSIEILVAPTVASPSSKLASITNGDVAANEFRYTAIGAGALGSQVLGNLVRSGFGKWTIIDHDHLLPHNTYRHELGGGFLGLNKAKALACSLNSLFYESEDVNYLPYNVLNLTEEQVASLNSDFDNSDAIIDLSASLGVARTVSRKFESNARRVSIFVNPQGTDLVVLSEDKDRLFPLEWLESNYYLNCFRNQNLKGHLEPISDTGIRYGNSCGDITTRIPQDHYSIHSGIAGRLLRKGLSNNEASMVLSSIKEDTSVSIIPLTLETPARISFGNWEIFLSKEAIARLIGQRTTKLPNETGGILVGMVDAYLKFITINDFLSAPTDSIEYPTSFIRGGLGLEEKIQEYSLRTLGNLRYVGEWHSHPDHCSVNASSDDKKAGEMFFENMSAENIPTMMLIVGENRQIGILFREPYEKEWAHQILDLSDSLS